MAFISGKLLYLYILIPDRESCRVDVSVDHYSLACFPGFPCHRYPFVVDQANKGPAGSDQAG